MNNDVEKIGILIAKKKYSRAIGILKTQLAGNPDNRFLVQQLADVLVLDGQTDRALKIFNHLAEDFAVKGFVTKAIAVLKRMQRIDPKLRGLEERITDLFLSKYGASELVSGGGPRSPAPPPSDFDTGVLKLADDEPTTLPLVSGLFDERDEDSEPLLLEPEPARFDGPVGLAGPAKSPLFGDFNSEELLAVVKELRLSVHEPGEIVFSEGEPGSSMFVLATGRLRVYVRNTRGQNTQVRILEPGAFFGEISVISGEPRTATITAAAYCELLELDIDAIRKITQSHPNLPEIIAEFYQSRRNSPEEQAARARAR